MSDKQIEKTTSENVLIRLKKIEGQIRGITSMIEQDRNCEDVITQLSAVSAGITAVAREVLFGHIEHHVVEGIKNGDEKEMVDGLKSAVESFAKLK